MNIKKLLLYYFALMTTVTFAQNHQNYVNDLSHHKNQIDAFLWILTNKETIDQQGNYNEHGTFIHNKLKQFKIHSELQSKSNDDILNCDSCPNYGLPPNYIEYLKKYKERLKEKDQKIIDNLKPFMSYQECMEQRRIKSIKKNIESLEKSNSSSWLGSMLGTFAMGILVCYIFKYQPN